MSVELDKAAILENFMDDEELLFESIDLFLERVEERNQALDAGVKAQDPDVVMVEAHTLKGMIGIFCTGSPFEAAKKLELMGREKNIANAEESFKQFQVELADLVQNLTAWRQTAG